MFTGLDSEIINAQHNGTIYSARSPIYKANN